jgi:hypothetical protein
MSKALLTALVATLTLGSLAPRLAAQDTTSATGQIRPDTSGYTGAGGVDTVPRPGGVAATDTIRLGADSSLIGGGAGVSDSGGIPGSIGIPSDSGTGMSDSSGTARPSPSPSTSPSGATSPSSTTSPGSTTNPSTGTSP